MFVNVSLRSTDDQIGEALLIRYVSLRKLMICCLSHNLNVYINGYFLYLV